MYDYVSINDGFFPLFGVLQSLPGLANGMKRWPFSLALPKQSDLAGLGRLMG
jgi:hypothetical protein